MRAAERRRRVVRVMGEDDFVVVLGLLAVAYLLFALSPGGPARVIVRVLYLAALAAAIVAVRPRRPVLVVAGLVALVPLTVALVLETVHPGDVASRAVDGAVAAVLLVTLLLVVERVLSRPKIGFQALAGALSAYLLIGLFFAAVFGAIAGPDSTTFFASHELATVQSLQYFSFTTLATLGYGDLTAAANLGRSLASLEAIIGQVFLATLVARLVSRYERRRAAAEDDDPAA